MMNPALLLSLACWASAGPPFVGSLLGRPRAQVAAATPGCRPQGDAPLRLFCPVDHLGAARKLTLILDDSERVLSIMVGYPPQPSAEAAELAVQPLLQSMVQERGAPQVKKTDGGREWVFSRSTFVGLVRIGRRGSTWQIQTLLSDPTYSPHILHRPPLPAS